MNNSTSTRTIAHSPKEVRDRGADLLYRLRGAGIWQYNRWFADKHPQWMGDTSRLHRITLILNGRGRMSDAELLKECEEIAARFIGGAKNESNAA